MASLSVSGIFFERELMEAVGWSAAPGMVAGAVVDARRSRRRSSRASERRDKSVRCALGPRVELHTIERGRVAVLDTSGHSERD